MNIDLVNEVIDGRYYVLEALDEGGSSSVFKAKDLIGGRVVALKKYKTSDPANVKKIIDGIEKELKILRYTSHPVLPKIYNIVKQERDFFLVMEYVEGINLKKYTKDKGRLKNKEVIKIMNQVCSGLYYLHSLEPPIVYRDLKPSNIMIRNDGSVKLIDFGIAKRYNRELYVDEWALGSKGFAAPEQVGDMKGHGLYNTDIRSDIYGVGTTIYYLKTGKIYQGQASSWRINYKLQKIIKKCTMSNPDMRYQNCIELLCDLNR